jgi:hypothetical protein
MADPSAMAAAMAMAAPPSAGTPAEAKDRLTAILEEYTALRAEVLQRSAAQNRIAQFHITILTTIVGAAILHPDLIAWLLLLIPVESALFGLWYVDHAQFIAKLGAYIHGTIEKGANQLCGQTVLGWEAELKKDSARASNWRNSLLAQLGFLPFALPCILAIVLSFWLLLDPATGKNLAVPDPFYQSPLQWIAWLAWLVGLGYFALYLAWVVRWYRPVWSGDRGANAGDEKSDRVQTGRVEEGAGKADKSVKGTS